MTKPLYACPSNYDDSHVLQDCECGRCELLERIAKVLQGAGVTAEPRVVKAIEALVVEARIDALTWAMHTDGADNPYARIKHEIAELQGGDKEANGE